MTFPGRYKELIQPDKLDIMSISVLGDSMTIAPGGIGLNIAYASAQLGETPILLSAAGQDTSDYLKHLEAVGVDISNIHLSDQPSASFTAFTDTDNNQMSGFYPGAMGDSKSLNLEKWSGQDVLFCLSAYDPDTMRRLCQQSSELGFRLFYDPGQQVTGMDIEDLKAGIGVAELVAINEYERSILCKRFGISDSELESMVPTLITTKGEDGSIIGGNNVSTPIEIAVAKADKIVDPTGAGDAYRAGFLYGYLRKWDLKACGQLGATVASFVLEKSGPQTELSKSAIVKRYKETFNEAIDL